MGAKLRYEGARKTYRQKRPAAKTTPTSTTENSTRHEEKNAMGPSVFSAEKLPSQPKRRGRRRLRPAAAAQTRQGLAKAARKNFPGDAVVGLSAPANRSTTNQVLWVRGSFSLGGRASSWAGEVSYGCPLHGGAHHTYLWKRCDLCLHVSPRKCVALTACSICRERRGDR